MTELGRHDPLVVDLRDVPIADWAELWEVLAVRCKLPHWFGRNLNAWWDTIQTGAISDVLDDHNGLILLIATQGMFAAGNDDGAAFLEVTNRCDFAEARATP